MTEKSDSMSLFGRSELELSSSESKLRPDIELLNDSSLFYNTLRNSESLSRSVVHLLYPPF